MESGRPLDCAIAALDRGLRSVFAPARTSRPIPGGSDPAPGLPAAERRASAALMRVNHAGELAAQALYHGQAFVARSAATRDMLMAAARSESDHLAWCETRLQELAARPDRKSTRLNSSHSQISYAVFCLKKKTYSVVGRRSPKSLSDLSLATYDPAPDRFALDYANGLLPLSSFPLPTWSAPARRVTQRRA